MSVVIAGGVVRPGDVVEIVLPPSPFIQLEPV
jgi:MOSC domain-containing protein YiiM